MIVSTKGVSNRYQSDSFHRAYGIQKWLCDKGYILAEGSKYKVDKVMYKELLKLFCLDQKPDFDFSRSTMEKQEQFVTNRFPQFCQYCTKLFKAKA